MKQVKGLIWKLIKPTVLKFLFWLLDTPFWYKLFKYTIPFIRLTTYYPDFPKFVYAILYRMLEPGDIILTSDYKKLTSKLVPGDWAHAAICVDKGEGKVEIVEMTHEGFHETDFHSLCAESERIRIKRVDDPRWDIAKFIKNVWKHKGSEYNFSFRAKEKDEPRKSKPVNKNGDIIHKFNYCSQLVTQADEDNILQVNWEDLAGLGVPYISPTGLDNGKNLITVADSGKI